MISEKLTSEKSDVQLRDLINIPDVQEMMESFYLVSHLPMSIVDLQGDILIGVGWQEVCTKFHRIHPVTSKNCLDSDLKLTAHIPKGEFMLYKCKNGMWDMATPIYLGDRKVGNLFTGQFFFRDEEVNYSFFTRQAEKYNFKIDEYITSLRKVPVLDRRDVENTKTFFIKLADTLVQLGSRKLNLESSVERTKALLEDLEDQKHLVEQSQAIAHLGSWELNLINNRLKWSDEVYRIFGIAREDANMTLESFMDCVHPDDRQKVEKAFEDSLLSGNNTYEIEHRIIRKNTGEIRYVHEKCLHTRSGKGKIIKSVGMVHDITERKLAEIQLKESEEKLNITLDVCGIGIWEWNIREDRLVCDSHMLKMLHANKGNQINRFKELESLIHEEDIAHFRKAVNESLNNVSPLQVLVRTKPSRNVTRYLSVKAIIDQSPEGNPLRMAGVCCDITGLEKETELLIDKLNEELLRSNKDLETFAYVASHDLQEPLRMVSSFMQLLEMNYKPGKVIDEQALEYIHYAVDGAKRMYELINGLLAYSRVNIKGIDHVMIDVNEVIDNIKSCLQLVIEDKDARVISHNLPVIYAEKNQISQLFQNLILNGIKFNNGKPEIKISCRRYNGKYIFSIKDNGIGIEPEFFNKIFQVFQRLNPRNRYEGTGIGLAICRRIVERHGGTIWVESTPGSGSTFLFTIPVHKPDILKLKANM